MTQIPRLGINVDHVATVRNARGGAHPDPVRAAVLAAAAGADGVTAHLREDRRHIRDEDIIRLKEESGLPLNFEMAATPEMQGICRSVAPHAVCLVPENRMERTTEGGLDVAGKLEAMKDYIAPLQDDGIRVSLFIDPETVQIEAAADAGAPVIELHTGPYHQAVDATTPKLIEAEFEKLRLGAQRAGELGLEVHAGHGLNYSNVQPVAAIPEIAELNIGHFLVGEALFVGLDGAVREMKRLIADARTGKHY